MMKATEVFIAAPKSGYYISNIYWSSAITATLWDHSSPCSVSQGLDDGEEVDRKQKDEANVSSKLPARTGLRFICSELAVTFALFLASPSARV